ncbi:MAG TPA: GatB/YqeY domain-containing protein [Epsilonproteobacteria bacterium]|nr:GatB/YqeY domain-containing protein [Campylobacterota bacterium]
MGLKQEIQNNIKDAMRNKDNAKRDTLRNIQTMIKQIEVDERRELSDDEIVKLIFKYAKQREDARGQFMAANRLDLVEKEDMELAIIEPYLPKQLNDDELKSKLQEIITSVGASSMQDIGKVMGAAKSALGNSADGSRINAMAKELLG